MKKLMLTLVGACMLPMLCMAQNTVKGKMTDVDTTTLDTVTLMDEVVITAVRAHADAPTTFTNLNKEDIARVNLGQDLPVLLSTTPSMVVGSDAGAGVGYTNLRIRGTDLNRINITLNGVPLNDAESHGVWWVNMPDIASSIDNIQIQRGVGTSTNGAAAFGASINMQTQKINKERFLELDNSFGSFNTMKNSISFGSGLLKEHFTLDGRLSRISSDGFIDRAFSKLTSLYLSGAWYDSKNMLRFNVIAGEEHTYQSWYGVPKVRLQNDSVGMMRYQEHGLYSEKETSDMMNADSRTYNYYTYDNETDNYKQDHYQLLYAKTLASTWTLHTALHYTYGRGYYENYKADADLSSFALAPIVKGADTINTSNAILQKWLDNDFYGITFSVLHDNKKRVKLSAGAALNRYHGRHFGQVIQADAYGSETLNHEWYRGTGVKDDATMYVKLNYKLKDSLSVYADMQGRYIEHTINGIDDKFRDLTQSHAFLFFNPKGGLNFLFGKHSRLYTSLAVASREPNRANYVDAPIGKEPTPETLYDVEGAYEYSSKKWAGTAVLYYMYYFDQLVLTGQINDVGAPIMTNVPYSFRRGIELISSWQLHTKLTWNASLTLSENLIDGHIEYVDNWDTWMQDSTYYKTSTIAFSPQLIANSNIQYAITPKLSASLMTQYVSRQYIDNSQSSYRSLDPYMFSNLLIQYRIKTKHLKDVSLRLLVNNIFNAAYETNAWVYRYNMGGESYAMDGYFPQAGTNFLLGLKVKL